MLEGVAVGVPYPLASTLILFTNLHKIANVKLSIKLKKLTYFNMLNISIFFLEKWFYFFEVDKKDLNFNKC